MGAKTLENAAAAAGFAMVNPDDFGAERNIRFEPRDADRRSAQETPDSEPPSAWSWLSWDYARLMGKATA